MRITSLLLFRKCLVLIVDRFGRFLTFSVFFSQKLYLLDFSKECNTIGDKSSFS